MNELLSCGRTVVVEKVIGCNDYANKEAKYIGSCAECYFFNSMVVIVNASQPLIYVTRTQTIEIGMRVSL